MSVSLLVTELNLSLKKTNWNLSHVKVLPKRCVQIEVLKYSVACMLQLILCDTSALQKNVLHGIILFIDVIEFLLIIKKCSLCFRLIIFEGI